MQQAFASWWRRAAGVGLALAGVLASAGLRAAPPPLEAFFERPQLTGAALSPDGRRVALRVAAKDARARLVVLDLETLQPTVVASFDAADVDRFEWVHAGRLVFDLGIDLVGPSRVEFLKGLYAVNADGSGFRQLVKSRDSFVQQGNDQRELLPPDTFLQHRLGGPDSRDVLVARARQNDRRGADYLQLHRVDTVNGLATEVETPLHSFAWRFDPRGQLRVVTTHENHRATVRWRQPDGSWKTLAEFEELGPGWMIPSHVTEDGTLYVEASHGGRAAVFTLDPATGKRSAAPVAASPRFDLHPRYITSDRGLLGLRYTIDAEVTQWLDAEMKAVQAVIDERLPATANRLHVPQRGDAPWVLVEALSDQRPQTTYLYHRGTKKLTLLGSSHPGIDPRAMGRTDLVMVRARDGREIPVWLTLPPGPAAGPRPMVVLLHGGPWMRGMHWHWDPEVQFLATRGYVVLQPEFRGSTGYGAAHFEAGFGQWGRAMQDDVADAAQWAIAQGHAAAGRICLAGASYGGYATLMGLVNDPQLFRCGVAWVGVTDVQLLFSSVWSDVSERAREYGMKRMIGDPVADADRLKAVSPVHQAARLRQPLLLAYGRWDTRVPLEHGERLRDALKAHNDQVEWVVYPNEGHGWRHAETRLDFWARVEAFLARQLGR